MRWLFLVLSLFLSGCVQEGGLSNLVGGDGFLRFNLQFDNEERVDLDLHVVTPEFEEIFYGSPGDSTGGSLDVDCLCGECPRGPNENIFWGFDGERPLEGTYSIGVVYYGACDFAEPLPTSSYTLRVLEAGIEVRQEVGVLGPDEVFSLDYGFGG